jgi:glycosyltransferase involved in cell wall biosynthesis
MRRHASECDLAVFHSYAGWRAVASAAARNVATVIAFHGLEPMYHEEIVKEHAPIGGLSWRYRWLQERLMPMFLQRACKLATSITCLNTAERDWLIQSGWATSNRIAVVSHGVGPTFFVPERRTRPVRMLLFVGQWLGMKGVMSLRDAFEILAARQSELRLTCAGTLAAEADVLSAFSESVRPRVTVLPRVDQPALAAVYRDADAFVFPSHYEGFGLAIVEAMASRLPIVVTPVGVAADALKDGDSALFVPLRDPDAIVRAVEQIIGNEALRSRIADGAALAARQYRETETVRAWAHTLTSINRVS